MSVVDAAGDGRGIDDRQRRIDLLAQTHDRGRQLRRARRCLAQPEGNCRRLPLRVLDAHASALDAQDAIRAVAQLEDVARQALDRKVLVQRADESAGRLEHHLVIGVVRNRSTTGDRGESRAAPRAQAVIDRVPMQVGAAAAASRAEALGEHAHDVVELGARESAIRPGAANQFVELVLTILARGDFGDDLLREHIERLVAGWAGGRARRARTASSSAAHSTSSSRLSGKSRPLGTPPTE